MRTVLIVLLGVALFGAVAYVGGGAQETEKTAPGYIGVSKCKMCHKGVKRGEQFEKWQASRHAKAYATLATPEAKAAAEKAGVEGDPQKSPQCLKCHVTGYGADAKLRGTSFKVEEGVQCEACHGPGSEYKSLKVMKNREASIAAGMIVPDEKTCVTCHNEESPTYKKFVFKEKVAKIAHPKPKEVKSQ